MSSDTFTFKHFKIRHDRCSMKVGTDGVLLGSWAASNRITSIEPSTFTDEHGEGLHFLDIGTGSGLIAMMLAQRFPDAHITAIDIDQTSIDQAKENVLNSPFHNQIRLCKCDFNHPSRMGTGTYLQPSNSKEKPREDPLSLIVSNPPFYEEDTANAIPQINVAKHTSSLTFEQLITGVSEILAESGMFDVIIPYSAAQRFISIAAMKCLYLTRRCNVRNSELKPFKRSLLSFGRKITNCENTTLTIRTLNYDFSEEYKELTKDFYINLNKHCK